MKKKSCLTLALILVIVQVVSLFAVLPVSAETTTKSYSLVKATEPMTVDGKADEAIWTRAVWSEQFVRVGGNYDGASSFNVRYKALWAPAENNKMNVYLLVVAKGVEIPTSRWDGGGIQIQMGNEAGTGYFWSGLRKIKSQILENPTAPNLTNGGSVADWSKSYQLAAVEDITGNKTVTFEFCYQMDKADSIKFDVMVRGGFYGSNWQSMDYSWAGTTNSTMENAPTGIGTILDQTYLYGIDIPKTTRTMTVDGKADEGAWSKAEWSEKFVRVGGNYDGASSFNVQYKALWAPAENNKMNVYLLVVAKGVEIPTSQWDGGGIQIQMGNEAGTGYFWSGLKKIKSQILENPTAPDLTNGGSVADWSKSYQLAAVEDITGSKTVTFEFCYQMDKADRISVDVMVRGGFYGSSWQSMDYSWAKTTNDTMTMEQAPAGLGNIIDADAEGVELTMTDGASVRVDTTEAKTSGIRFASTVNLDQYNALLAQGATITTGTLIVPTNSLSVKEIADADFTKETLVAKGLIENTHFYDIENTGNEWVKGEDGTWYATLYDIQDYERLFSAVGYVTVKLNGVSTTYYAEYYSVDARSIAQVAETLMSGEPKGDEGKWTAAQEAVLKNFFTQEAQS